MWTRCLTDRWTNTVWHCQQCETSCLWMPQRPVCTLKYPLNHQLPSAAQLNLFRTHLPPMSQDTWLQLFSNLTGVCRASDCTEHSQQRRAERQKQAAAVDLCPGPGHDTSHEAPPLPENPPLEVRATRMPEIRTESRGQKAFTAKWFQSCNAVSA